jgi:hypothetical protein
VNEEFFSELIFSTVVMLVKEERVDEREPDGW